MRLYEAGNWVYEKCEALVMVCWTLLTYSMVQSPS